VALLPLPPLIDPCLSDCGGSTDAFGSFGGHFTARLVYSLGLEIRLSPFLDSNGEPPMKRAFLASLAIFALSLYAAAQSASEKPAGQQQQAPPQATDLSAKVPAARPDDVKSIDSMLAALYGVISGPAGERDWNRFRSLFLPQARLTSATKRPDGTWRIHAMGVEDYAKGAGDYFAQHGFFESAIVNRIQTFGNVSQVFSSYESRHAAAEAPFARGINSIQMLYDGHRWWIVSILWDEERGDNPLPREFAAGSSGDQK
jgi:hypothetical protein